MQTKQSTAISADSQAVYISDPIDLTVWPALSTRNGREAVASGF